jgi:hypothetical protein
MSRRRARRRRRIRVEENSRRADEQGADPDNTDERETELTIVFV